jgi:hypothetical protein
MQYQIVWFVFGWSVTPLNGAPVLKNGGHYVTSLNDWWVYEFYKLPFVPIYMINPLDGSPAFHSGVWELRDA